MPAVASSLQLDNDELALTVNTEQVDAPVHISEVAELLRHDKQIVPECVNVTAECPLEIGALQHMLSRECCRRHAV